MNAIANVKLLPFELEVVSGPHLGQKYAFVDKVSISIGRGTENDICLQHDPRVSRVHTEIRQENEVIYVYNKTNKNSLLINGLKEDQAKITQSCIISIGETELKFIFPQVNKNFKSPLQPLSAQNPVAVGVPGPVFKNQVPSNYSLPPLSSVPPNVAAPPPRKKKAPKKQENFNALFLIVIVAIIIVGIFVLPTKPEDKPVERAPEIITPVMQEEQRLQESLKRAREAMERLENRNSRQTMAEQFFVSGIREYLNGNYQRAISFLNSAYQSDPTMLDAEKFSRDAQRKLDRMIDLYFAEGLKYRENNNYRMCKASFQIVQTFIRNNLKHPRYIEAKQFFEECANLDKVRRF